MGTFSFLTADTRESVTHRYSNHGAKPVYLLQPNGQAPILEDNYQGYGEFGGQDIFVWLARQNLPGDSITGLSDNALRDAGLDLHWKKACVDARSGEQFELRVPVKVSFNPSAVYEDLPASKDCPDQGDPEDY